MPSFKCGQCGLKSKRLSDIHRHLLTAHTNVNRRHADNCKVNGKARKYICGNCGFESKQFVVVRSHRRIHKNTNRDSTNIVNRTKKTKTVVSSNNDKSKEKSIQLGEAVLARKEIKMKVHQEITDAILKEIEELLVIK